MALSKRVVMPGEPLCVEEEFMAGPGTYLDESGVVRAAIIGEPVFDMASRRVSVRPLSRKSLLPKQGDVVVGVVSAVKEDVAIVKVLGFDIYAPFKNPLTGLLHISQISEHRLESIYDAIRLGDLIKAKVLNSYVPLLLGTKEPRLGVILAHCSQCGAVLVKKDSALTCPRCGNKESRKISIEYMAIEKRGPRRS